MQMQKEFFNINGVLFVTIMSRIEKKESANFRATGFLSTQVQKLFKLNSNY